MHFIEMIMYHFNYSDCFKLEMRKMKQRDGVWPIL